MIDNVEALPQPTAERPRLHAALRRPANWLQLLRFAIVGASGYAINLAVFAAQAFLWASNLMRRADGIELGRRFSVGSGGAIAATAAHPLVCDRDLRVSLGVMTFGMAYMLAAMQLML